jgi:hypothetical protein
MVGFGDITRRPSFGVVPIPSSLGRRLTSLNPTGFALRSRARPTRFWYERNFVLATSVGQSATKRHPICLTGRAAASPPKASARTLL